MCLEGVVTTTLPSEQTAPAWGFDANANISYATATDNNKSLTFQNTCGLVKFKNNLTDLTGIKLTAGGDVKIAGNVKIDASANLTVESGSNVITLTAKEGTFVGPNEQNKNAKEYSMVVAPVTFTDGFTLELTRNSGTKTYNFSGENLIVTKGQIVTIVLNDDQGGGEPPVDLEKQTTVAVSSAKEIVPDQTTGNDRIELTLDKEVSGTFTDAVNKAFTITVAGKTIPVASGSVNGTTMTLILGDKIYSNDANISVSYNTDYAVSALTAKNENNEDANIKIESANVALTHADAFDFNFANIDAVKEYLAEGVAEKLMQVENWKLFQQIINSQLLNQCHSVMVVLTNLLIHTHLTTVQQHSDWEHLININSGLEEIPEVEPIQIHSQSVVLLLLKLQLQEQMVHLCGRFLRTLF